MNKQDRHIVSKINWDLAYDNRQDVQDLQSTFGAWTKADMLQEMNALFNQLCPSDQTWQINTLELDLGEMLKDDIDEELPKRFRAALYEKLIELTYGSGRGNHDLKVLNGNDSLLHLLEKYLESGYLPWNETGIVSINELFLNQLKNNNKALLKMILHTGQSEKVRKRIAWQFQEPAIKKLINLIEPSNSNQILTFTEEFAAIQEKETIVRSNVSDFKKNLWYWVLNHLFDERGTLFNRVEFMESSIHQMAQHHNMDYHALFSEIQRAVQQITALQHVDSSFILTLSLLSKKNSKTDKAKGADSKDVMFVSLNEYFSKNSDDSQTYSVENWNELVIQLANNNSKDFKRLLRNQSDNQQRLNELVSNLDETGLAAFLKTLFGNQTEKLIASIQLLNVWSQKSHISLKNWYTKAAHVLLSNKQQEVGLESFLMRLIQEFKLDPKVLFEETGQALKNNRSNTSVQPEVFKTTLAVVRNNYFAHMESTSKWTIEPYLHFFLSEEWNFISIEGRIDQLKGQNKFTDFINKKPALFLQFLQDQKWTNTVKERFVALLQKDQLLQMRDVILKTNSKSNIAELNEFEVFLNSLTAEMGDTFEQELYTQALSDTLKAKLTGAERVKFLMTRIIQIMRQDGNSRLRIKLQDFSSKLQTNNLLKDLFKQELPTALSIANPSFNTLLATVAAGNGYTALKTAKKLIQIRESSGKDWVTNFNQSVQTLVLHFLPTEKKWTKKLISGRLNLGLIFGNTFQSNLSIKRQTVIFWNVLLDYEAYNGNYKRFKAVLQDALTIRDKQQGITLIPKQDSAVNNKAITDKSIINTQNKLSSEHKVEFNTTPIAKQDSIANKKAIAHKALTERLHKLSSKSTVEFNADELNQQVQVLLKNEPAAFFTIFKTVNINDPLLDYFEQRFSLDQFVVALANYSAINVSEFQVTLSFLSALANQKGDRQTQLAMKRIGWKLLLFQSKKGISIEAIITELIQGFITELILKKGLETKDIITVIQSQNIQLSPIVLRLLVKMNPVFAEFSFEKRQTIHEEGESNKKELQTSKSGALALTKLLKSNLGVKLLRSLLLENKIPNWFDIPDYSRVDTLIAFIIREQPQLLVNEIVRTNEIEHYVRALNEKISIANWLKLLATVNGSQRELIGQVKKLFNCFNSGEFSLILKNQLNEILFRKTVIALKTSNWRVLSSEKIWNEIMWDVKVKYGQKEEEVLQAFQRNEAYLPVGLRVSFQRFTEKLQGHSKTKRPSELINDLQDTKKEQPMEEKQALLTEGIAINNAGLVLASSYINVLFDRLNLIKDGSFVSSETRIKAVHYLQFVVNGIAQNEEHHLVLNKILAGLHPTSPVTSGIEISTDEKQLIEGLIQAIIGHWPSIGDTSIDGFRGNWLIRDGVLREEVDRWTLDVEKRAYDILLNKSPFSFGIIKFPWIDKPIHVNWPY
ncbi:MAG: hypothetical protein GQ574_13160 [Crocinitomix sp.]|nr:hypothetical protein [Crocinitomix sp.]